MKSTFPWTKSAEKIVKIHVDMEAGLDTMKA